MGSAGSAQAAAEDSWTSRFETPRVQQDRVQPHPPHATKLRSDARIKDVGNPERPLLVQDTDVIRCRVDDLLDVGIGHQFA